MRKKYTSWLLSMILFFSIFNNFAHEKMVNEGNEPGANQEIQEISIAVVDATGELVVPIDNKDFEAFLNRILHEAYAYCSESLIRCHQQIKEEQKVYVRDLKEALPEIIACIDGYCEEQSQRATKAPRPIPPSQQNLHAISGSTNDGCNINNVIFFVERILAELNICCADRTSSSTIVETVIIAGFNGTFSMINEIKNEILGTYTVLTDLSNTLTACCANAQINFNGTFSAINAGFNGTFTVINDIINNINFDVTFSALNVLKDTLTECCATIQKDFQETWTIINALNPSFTIIVDFQPGFQQTWTIIQAGFNGTFSALDACCTNITREFQETWTMLAAGFDGTFSSFGILSTFSLDCGGTFSALADIRNTLSTDFQATWTIINAGFNGTFSVLNSLNTATVATAGFQGTFSALNACCTNITHEFQQTWTILAAGFNSTFSVIDTIANNIVSSPVDVSAVFTVMAAGFNGTFSSITNLENTLVTNFNGTFTVLDAFTGCFATAVTTGGTITNPGYYCFANDINGSFTITANNVVLDLNNHVLSNGGIFVLTGTNRAIKNGRLDNSNTGIVLTANTNSVLKNLIITNALLTPAITFTGVHFDNRVTSVVIESCKTGLSSTNDNNLNITDLTIQGATSAGMTFTTSNNLMLNKVSIFNTGANGIDLTNPVNANLYDVIIYNAVTQGIVTYGTATQCIFENIEITNANMLFGINLTTATSCLLRNCSVAGIGSTTYSNTVTGIFLGPTIAQGGSDNTLDSCAVKNLNSTSAVNGIVIRSANTKVNNCIVQFLNSGNIASGFLNDSTDTTYFNCYANNINSTGGTNTGSAYGYSLGGSNSQVFNSVAHGVNITNINGNDTVGFRINASDISCYDCVSNNITSTTNVAYGFRVTSLGSGAFLQNCTATVGNFLVEVSNTTLRQCQAYYTLNDGFKITPASGVTLSECSAMLNSLFGLDLPAGNTDPVYHCVAARNSGGDFNNVPNPQTNLASPTLPGSNVRIVT